MKKGNVSARPFVLSALALAVAPAMAQVAIELSESVVTATRNPQLQSAALAHTTVISRADIEQSQAVDLVTLLEREAGLQRIQNGGVGTVGSIFVRGSPSLQSLILVDGVPLNKRREGDEGCLHQPGYRPIRWLRPGATVSPMHCRGRR